MGTSISDKLGYLATSNELQTAIHNGIAYGTDWDGTINGENSLKFLGKITTKDVHFHVLEGSFEKGDIRISLYENPTITADGTAVTTIANLNRNFSDDNTVSMYLTPTATGNGTKIGGSYVPISGLGSGVQSSKAGVAGGRVLKKNTNYLIVIENLDTFAVKGGLTFIWDEHIISAM